METSLPELPASGQRGTRKACLLMIHSLVPASAAAWNLLSLMSRAATEIKAATPGVFNHVKKTFDENRSDDSYVVADVWQILASTKLMNEFEVKRIWFYATHGNLGAEGQSCFSFLLF